jgi:Acetoacetate decarboxylase (ADC)
MIISHRQRWITDRYANVDGIPFRMPVGTRASPALIAGFSVDAARAGELLPSQELTPLRFRGRSLLVIAVVNYLDTVIGRYVEFCIGVLCVRSQGSLASRLSRGLLSGVGVYIYDLPVSTEISVKGGLGIWGMPKRQANLDFVVGDDTVSSQYDLDGQLVMRIDIPRPKHTRLPLRAGSFGYGSYRGMLTRSRIRMRGAAGVCVGRGSRARLAIGDHERAVALKRLDVCPAPVFTAFLPAMSGVLDDHVETWFLTADQPPEPPPVGLPDVVRLGLGQRWLAPPNRDNSDRLLRELTPGELVGSRTA